MSTLKVNNIEPTSGNSLVISSSAVTIPGDLTVTGNIIGNISGSVEIGGFINIGSGASQVMVISGSLIVSGGNTLHNVGAMTTGLNCNVASGSDAMAQGINTFASGNYSHAEGFETSASGDYSHAEGYNTHAFGNYSHAEGGSTIALGDYSHAEGQSTIASGSFQHIQGQFNTHGDATSLMIVGNGTGILTRSDAFKVRMSGSIVLPTTQSAAPSWTGTDGEIIPATVGGQYFLYMWMNGAWRSGSFV